MSSSSHAAPMRLALYSTAARERPPRTKQGLGDILVDNDPYNKEYHLAVCAPSGRVLYDLPARCEPRGAIAVPINGDGYVALIRQWRPVPAVTAGESSYPLDAAAMSRRGFWSWELPRGFPNEGENGADAARRETLEETNLHPVYVKPLGWLNFNTSVMLSDQPLYLVKVVESKCGTSEYVEDGENIQEVRWFDMDSLRAFVLEGRIRCSVTLAGLAHVFASNGAQKRQTEEFEATVERLHGLHPVFEELVLFLETIFAKCWEMGVCWDALGIERIDHFIRCFINHEAKTQ